MMILEDDVFQYLEHTGYFFKFKGFVIDKKLSQLDLV